MGNFIDCWEKVYGRRKRSDVLEVFTKGDRAEISNRIKAHLGTGADEGTAAQRAVQAQIAHVQEQLESVYKQAGVALPGSQPAPQPVSSETPPAEPATLDFRSVQIARVKQEYPNSPELATAVEMAVTDTRAQAVLDQKEPKAKLIEELAKLDEQGLADRLTAAGADTDTVRRLTFGNRNFRSAADVIFRAQEKSATAVAPAPAPEVPATPEPPAPKRRRSKPRAVLGDVLDMLEDFGGLVSATRAKASKTAEEWERDKAEWDDAPRLSNPTHNFIYGNGMGGRGGVTPDDAVSYLQERGMLPENALPADMWALVEQASKGREILRKQGAAKNRNMIADEKAAIKQDKSKEKQDADFAEATSEGNEQVTTWDLFAGDTLEVEGEQFAVTGIVIDSDAGQVTIDTGNGQTEVIQMDDASPGDAILEDGARFGRQRLSTGEAIYVERHNRTVTAEEVTDLPAPPESQPEGFALAAPEPTQIAAEQAAAANRAEMARRAAAPLRGTLQAGDQTPDMLDSTAGKTPLFAQQTARTAPSEFESRLREKIAQEGLKNWTEQDIQNAIMFHVERKNEALPSKVKRSVVSRVEMDMQTPAERRAQRAEEARELQRLLGNEKADIARSQQTTDPIKNTDPALVQWADVVVDEGNINAGLNLRLLAAHAVRSAYYLKQTGANFAQWSRRMVIQFGEGIRKHLGRIWDNARRLLQEDGDLDAATSPAPFSDEAADFSPLPPADINARADANPYADGLWEAANVIADERNNAEDFSVLFAMNASDFGNIPEIIEGNAFGFDGNGRTWIITDQVHVTEADRKAAAANDRSAAEQALRRTMDEAKAAQTTRNRATIFMARQNVLFDLESSSQWTGLVNDLWTLNRVEMESIVQDGTGDQDRALRAGMLPLSQNRDAWNQMMLDRETATRIWLADAFSPHIEARLNGEEKAPVTSDNPVIQEISDLVEDTLAGHPPVRFSAQQPQQPTRPAVISKGVSAADVQSAIRGLSTLLPNLKNTWTGTSYELVQHLRSNEQFQDKWKQHWKRRTGNSSASAATNAWNAFLADGLTGIEALSFDGRTYLMTDQIDITMERGGTGPLAARWVLNHEHTHEVTDHILARFPELRDQWRQLRNRVNPAQLDRLAQRWTWLADWRNNEDLHDQIVHEWAAERIAQIETRGQPDPDSLIGKILQWFRDVWRAAMGVGADVNPNDRALLDFIEAARDSYRETLQDPDGSQLRFSAANPSGDANPDSFKNQIEGGTWEAPPPKPVYNLWSDAKRKVYEEFQKNADIPEDLRHFAQFMGNETDQVRITQTLRPMQDMARTLLGSTDGDYVPVTPENTATAWELARKMLSRKTFAKNYIREFQLNWSPRDTAGNPIHQGDAAVAVLQLELMDYAARLLAETGDAKLYLAFLPFANDTIIGDYQTMSSAGRLLQVRSAAVRQDGLYTALKSMVAGMEEAAASDIGQEAMDDLKKSVEPANNPELAADIAAEVEEHLASPEGTQEAEVVEATAEDYETDGYWERVLSMFQGQERADLFEFRNTLHQLDRLIQQQEFLNAQAASAARPSVSEDAGRFMGKPEDLQKLIDEKKAKLLVLLGKMTQQNTSSESKEVRKTVTRGKGVQRAVKLLTADEQAKKLIERFENRNKRVRRETPAWRQTFNEQVKNPVSEDDFVAKIQNAEISEDTARRLFEVADDITNERKAQASARRTKAAAQSEDKRLDKATSPPTSKPRAKSAKLGYKALINSISRQISQTPLNQQGDPTWVRNTFINAFTDMGFPRAIAEKYADKIAPKYTAILTAAQDRAAQKAGKRLKVKEPTMKRIGEAIRTGALDPLHPNPVVRDLAKAAGYEPMTPEEFQMLAQLDQQINMGFPTLAALAYTKVERILAKLRPKKAWQKVWAQLFTNGALSSLGVFSLNWLHPTYIFPRRMATDLASLAGDAIAGKGSRTQHIALMGAMFTNLWEARKNWLNEARFSLANDAYSNRMLEILNAENSLYEDLMRAVRQTQSGNAKDRAWGAIKVAWLSSDWVRRMLASADQTWGSVIQEFVMRNEAMRMMVQDAGMTVEQASLVIQRAADEGAAAQLRFTNSGEDGPTAALIGRDVLRESLARGLSHLMPQPQGKPTAGQNLLTTIQREAETELGNRRSEDSRTWDLPNVFLEVFKSAASAVRKRTELLGRPLTGFVSVGANLLNRSLYFTPWGALRVLDKSTGTQAKRDKIYSETMATDAQRRMRLYESIIGTISLLILEIFRWKPEDKEWGIQITGNGPKDRNLADAWAKRGNKKGHVQLMDAAGNVQFSISYTRGGFDHLAVPLTFAGAHTDMDIEGLKPTDGAADYAWAYAQTVGGNMVKQAQFFGAKAMVGGIPTSSKPHAIAGLIGYNVNPFTPWGGLTRSIGKMITGPQDASSWNTAILSSMPIVQPLLGAPGELLNSLGDPVGAQPPEMWKRIADRAEFAGLPFYLALDPDSKDQSLYDFMMRAGAAPSVPLRSTLENKNGFLEDEQWKNYVKYRGQLLKDALRAAIPSMNRMEPKDVQREMETISRDATRAAKEKLGLQ